MNAIIAVAPPKSWPRLVAITPAARTRRMTLVQSYLDHLRSLGCDAACDALESLWNDTDPVTALPKPRAWILETN